MTDILLVLLCYLPKALSIYAKQWFLGGFICYITAFIQFAPGTSEILTLTAITSYKFYIIRRPLKNNPKVIYVKLVIAIIWVVSSVNPAIFVLSRQNVAIYNAQFFSCVTDVVYNHRAIVLFSLVALAIIPMITTIILNLCCLGVTFIFNKSRSATHNKTAITTVSAICVVFIISWIPYIIRVTAAIMLIKLPSWFQVTQQNFNMLSVTLNPLVYTIIDRRFRRFVVRRLLKFKRNIHSVGINMHWL